jgi:shikimate dehydrogenase
MPTVHDPKALTSAGEEILTGLIGSGIRASSSPALHMEEARSLGLRLRYTIFDLDEQPKGVAALDDLLATAELAGYAGLNITHPCKQLVIKLLHELSEDARALGAVNTIVFSKGRRIGHNTDWWGFAEGFRRGLPGASVTQVTQLGAGGAGSAVAYAMLQMGAQQLQVFDLDQARAEQMIGVLSTQFGSAKIRVGINLAEAMHASAGVINATPVGMLKYPGLPLPVSLLNPSKWVAEIVYFPLETALLREARAIGCPTVDGGGMVVFQAAEAFRLFTGIKPDALRMLARFRNGVAR